ncbi:Zn(2)-C6 fungal-type DNA-binding domain [Aspergillus oryzae]|uniref:Zn(2)-C6 fungal-type DNA-binding domain n=1 Tax=Aspergillus oryzae TaxID=5062 RepID=A0A1S9DHN4_ASPOZ|nr:Zn(2)-C6 fungal-type DNA-binding domain [Aspergillus oryzae]
MQSYSRVSVACEACRKRKRKCDGLRPTCSYCLERNRICEYTVEKRVKRRVDPDYVRTLEDEIAILKQELAQAPFSRRTILDDDMVHAQGEPKRSSEEDGAVAIHDSMTTAIEDVSALIWRMSLDNNGDASFIGPSGNFCFPVTHWDAADFREKRKAVATPTASTSGAPHIPAPWPDPINILGITNYLLDVFANLINPIQQFVDSETLDQLRGDDLSHGLRLVKTAALAAAALVADGPQSKAICDEAAAAFDKTALQLCRELPEISTIQSLSIMSWRELGLEQHNMAWMYNCSDFYGKAMCASLVLHLGLPVIITPDRGPASRAPGELSAESRTRDSRLRTLWSSVLMDRIATSLLGRNCLLPWKRIKCPSFLSAVGPSPSLDELAFDYQCRLWFIHDQYMDKIYSFDFSELSSTERSRLLLDARDQLLSFYRQIHPSLQLSRTSITTETPTPAVIYLHISYHMSFILIHRPYLKVAARNNPTIYRLALRSVTTAAASIVRLLRIHANILPLSLAPPFIVHSVLTAAVTHLCNATSTHNTLRSQSIAHFRVCFRALLVMQSRWVKATRAIRLLRGLAHRWRVMGALPLQYGFEAGGGGEAEETGWQQAEAEAEEGEREVERENEDEEREEDGRIVDTEENWPLAAEADAANSNFDGDEMEMFDSIRPETFVFDPEYRQWELSMGLEL